MIDKLIAECTDYDFKAMLEEKKPRSWLKSVSAFANGSGGSLFFGVDDKGVPVGVSDAKGAISKISELIKSRIDPIPAFTLTPYEENGAQFIQLDVFKGLSTPYYYHGDGNLTAYIRSGSESIEAPRHILNELILKGTGQTYDSVLTGESVDDYSFSYLTSKYKATLNMRLFDEDLASFGLCEGRFLSRAGILLADMNKMRQSRIFCTRWNGTDKISEEAAINDNEINGSLLIQLDRAMEFFRSNTKVKWRKEKGDTVYEPDFDEEAIKEAIVNAIVHRDYNVIGAEIVLNIYDDRIEITSPGGMYSGKAVPHIVNDIVESKRRNPVIADLFHRLKLMNRRGSGLANITNRTNRLFGDGANHVFYRSDDEFFLVRIDNANFRHHKETDEKSGALARTKSESLSKTDADVLKLIGSSRYMTANEMARVLSISRSTVIRAANHLTTGGYIARFGSNKSGHWEVIKNRH